MAAAVVVALVENRTSEIADVLNGLVPDPRCRRGRLGYGLFVAWLPGMAANRGNQGTNKP